MTAVGETLNVTYEVALSDATRQIQLLQYGTLKVHIMSTSSD